MKVDVVSIKNEKAGQTELPKQFEMPVRPDLIKKAVLNLQNARRQPYGADPDSGLKASAKLSRRRRNYRGSYGIGISRVPRKIVSRQGRRMNWIGAVAPGTVGGRRAHAPKAEKIWTTKINTKERRNAILSALSATINLEYVKSRGHKVPASYPFVLETKVEEMKTTKAVVETLKAIGFTDELLRTKKRSIRAGQGKLRGRKYKTKTGPLLVVSSDCELSKAAKNIPGVDVVKVDNLNAESLAPGTDPGRMTVFTQSAVERLAKEKLFLPEKPKTVKSE